MRLDQLDRRLIALLSEDARIPVTGLAHQLGVARSTVQKRLARLEASGVIAGYTVRVGTGSDGSVLAYVQIVVDPRQVDRVVGELAGIPAVRELHAVAGPVDLMAVIRTASPSEMDSLLDRIGRTAGVERTASSVVLSTRLRRGEIETSVEVG